MIPGVPFVFIAPDKLFQKTGHHPYSRTAGSVEVFAPGMFYEGGATMSMWVHFSL